MPIHLLEEDNFYRHINIFRFIASHLLTRPLGLMQTASDSENRAKEKIEASNKI